jgi:hypothetical protein
MKPFRSPQTLLAAAGSSLFFPLLASAHPGHDHSNIPSVIRHPFAGVEHVAIVLSILLVGAGVCLLAARLGRGSSRHDARSRSARRR